MANAKCTICGKDYEVCNSCLEQKTFKPWRTVTDSIEHYKIYLAIHGYTISKDEEKAKADLRNCVLSEIENFLPEIQTVIKKILSEPKLKKSFKKEKEYLKTDEKNEGSDFCE